MVHKRRRLWARSHFQAGLSECKRSDAQHHADGRRDPLAGLSFRQEMRSHDRAEENAHFPGGGDVTDRREAHGGEYEDVRRRHQDPDRQHVTAMMTDVAADLGGLKKAKGASKTDIPMLVPNC